MRGQLTLSAVARTVNSQPLAWNQTADGGFARRIIPLPNSHVCLSHASVSAGYVTHTTSSIACAVRGRGPADDFGDI